MAPAAVQVLGQVLHEGDVSMEMEDGDKKKLLMRRVEKYERLHVETVSTKVEDHDKDAVALPVVEDRGTEKLLMRQESRENWRPLELMELRQNGAAMLMTNSNIEALEVLAQKRGCTTPPSLRLAFDKNKTKVFAKGLQQEVNGTNRRMKPFAWIRYGDGEFMSMVGDGVGNSDGADLTSECVRD